MTMAVSPTSPSASQPHQGHPGNGCLKKTLKRMVAEMVSALSQRKNAFWITAFRASCSMRLRMESSDMRFPSDCSFDQK